MKPAVFLAFLLALSVAAPARAQTGLPLPRFASLRRDQVNLRTGPGMRYPVEWVYVRKDLPVEIVSEFEHWRKIRDFDGTQGWVHRHMLSGRRAVRAVANGELKRAASEDSLPLARYEKGVIGKIERCPENMAMCQVDFGGFQGWTRKDNLWGVYAKESIE